MSKPIETEWESMQKIAAQLAAMATALSARAQLEGNCSVHLGAAVLADGINLGLPQKI